MDEVPQGKLQIKKYYSYIFFFTPCFSWRLNYIIQGQEGQYLSESIENNVNIVGVGPYIRSLSIILLLHRRIHSRYYCLLQI